MKKTNNSVVFIIEICVIKKFIFIVIVERKITNVEMKKNDKSKCEEVVMK